MKSIKILLLAAMLLPVFANAQQPNAVKRGVSYEEFKKSVSDFSDTSKTALAQSSWNLWKHKNWTALEQLFTANNLNGGWPPNRGAVSLKIRKMKAGWLIDRYGGYYDADSVFQDKGTFVSREGVPFAKRALPDKTLNSPYHIYKIAKPIAGVRKGKIIPWFGKQGLGWQYELPGTVNDLKRDGYVAEEKGKETGASR